MEFIFEAIFQFLGEIGIQLLAETLLELGFHSLGETLERPRNAVLSTIGFALWGALAGGISLLIMPHSLISNANLRLMNVVVTPLIAGGVMMFVGRQRSKRGQSLVKLDRFGYAFVFALTMALVRFIAARPTAL